MLLRNCQFYKQDHQTGTTEQSTASRSRAGGAVLAFGLQLKVLANILVDHIFTAD